MNVGCTTRKISVIVLLTSHTFSGAQSRKENDALVQQTQERGYWVDQSSGLMWAAKDNGKNVNWHQATSYCQKLRVGGYADWRLATIEELEEINGSGAERPENVSKQTGNNSTVRGGGELVLSGDPWSNSRTPGRLWWYLSRKSRTRVFDNPSFSHAKRAVCVYSPLAQRGGLASA